MARIQQSIDIGVPVHTVFMQLTHFEDYPQFLQNVQQVRQIDDTHYHWSVRTPLHAVDWDSEITERRPDECIRWRNDSGPIHAGSIELEPVDVSLVRVTMTYDCDPLQLAPVQDGNADREVAQRMQQDLQRFKSYVETHESQASDMIRATQQAEADLARDALRDRLAGNDRSNDDAAIASPGTQHAGVNASIPTAQGGSQSGGMQAARSAQSENSLSGQATDMPPEQPLNVAEEIAFDQQSAQARQVGQAPENGAAEPGRQPGEAMADSMRPDADAPRKR